MVSLLDNGSCFRKVAPNTRSSEKSRIACRDQVSGCMANAPTAELKGPLLYSSPPVATSRSAGPVCHQVARQPGTGFHLCGNPTSPPCGAHGISACCAAIRLCVVFGAGRGGRTAHACTRATRAYGVYVAPIPTCSAWIATAAQKLWSPGSPRPLPSPMLGAASRGSWGPARLLSLL